VAALAHAARDGRYDKPSPPRLTWLAHHLVELGHGFLSAPVDRSHSPEQTRTLAMASAASCLEGGGGVGTPGAGGGGGDDGGGGIPSWCGGGCRVPSVGDDGEICGSSNPAATPYSLFPQAAAVGAMMWKANPTQSARFTTSLGGVE
jgi:hypothetical protein